MKRIRFLKRNVVYILCVAILIGYSFIEFETYTERILFVSILLFLSGGLLFITTIAGMIFRDRFRASEILFLMKYEIIAWIVSAIIVLLLGGLKIAKAISFGLLIYTVLMFGIFWFKSGRKKMDPDPE